MKKRELGELMILQFQKLDLKILRREVAVLLNLIIKKKGLENGNNSKAVDRRFERGKDFNEGLAGNGQ